MSSFWSQHVLKLTNYPALCNVTLYSYIVVHYLECWFSKSCSYHFKSLILTNTVSSFVISQLYRTGILANPVNLLSICIRNGAVCSAPFAVRSRIRCCTDDLITSGSLPQYFRGNILSSSSDYSLIHVLICV